MTIFSPGFSAMPPFSHRPPLAQHAGGRAAWPWFGSSMLRSIAAALGAALLLAGCVAGPEVTAGPDPAEIARVTSSAAAQVRRCYRSPRVLSEARQIVTRLRVRFAPDGTLVESPTVLAQLGLTPVNRPYAGAMAAAAVEAVTRCAPLSLPRELHARGWDEFELTFSPAARA